MESSVETVIRETLENSNAGKIHFGQVVASLMSVGVESYNVDYRAARATYYTPNGETLTIETSAPEVEIAKEFSETAIKSAILGAQRGEVKYPEFKKLSQHGGCVGYTVWIGGRHVCYFGRNGETHIERFPNAK